MSFHCPPPGPCHAAVTLDLRTSRENDRSLDSMEQGRLEERGEERSGLRAVSEPHRATSPRLKTASDDAPSHRRPNPCPEPSCLASPAGCPTSPASQSSKRSPANTTTTSSAAAVAGAASRRSRERITMKRTGED
jgi:hypothetical protein